MLPKAVMTIVTLVNSGGGRHTRTTKYPIKEPMIVLRRTLTGINHQRTMLSRVMLSPSSVKIKQGRNRAKTSLLKRRKVALGTSCVLG